MLRLRAFKQHIGKSPNQPSSLGVGYRFVCAARSVALCIAVGAGFASQISFAQSADDLDVLRVDLPLNRDSFDKNDDVEISALIANNTYIDVDEFYLRAVELEAHSNRQGEVRLKAGRYVTPPVPLPNEAAPGLLRIEAPHKTNHTWRLLIEDQVTISSLTAVLEPRHDNPSYYQSRYEQRGYRFGADPYLRNDWRRQSRLSNWPYSWLGTDYDYNRRASHWLWLSDTRSRFQLNPSFGLGHRHTRDCYDQFGRHLTFTGQLRDSQLRYRTSRNLSQQRAARSRNYLHERRRTSRDVQNLDRSATDRRSTLTPRLEASTNTKRRTDARRQAQRAQQAQRVQRIQQAQQRSQQERRAQSVQKRAQQSRSVQNRSSRANAQKTTEANQRGEN